MFNFKTFAPIGDPISSFQKNTVLFGFGLGSVFLFCLQQQRHTSSESTAVLQMALWGKASVLEPDNLSSIPESHIVADPLSLMIILFHCI